MKLKQIVLKSFRSGVDLEIPLTAPRVLIAGVNGVGKTNVREGISWALTGRCQYTDGKGAGAEDLIPEGRKEAEVVVNIDGIGPLARTYREKGGGTMAVVGWTGTAQVQQAALYGRLGVNQTALEACLDTEVFLRLHHAEAKSLILGLLDVRVTHDGTTYTLDEIDAGYKKAFQDRADAKRVLASIVLPPEPADVQFPEIEKIEAQLGKLNELRYAQDRAIGKVQGERRMLQTHLDSIPLPSAIVDVSEKIEAAKRTVAALEAEAAQPATPPAKGDPKRVTFLKSRMEALAAHNPAIGCVLGADLPCMTDVSEFQARHATLQVELAEAQAAVVVPATQQVSPLVVAKTELAMLEKQQRTNETTRVFDEKNAATKAKLAEQLAALPETATQEAELAELQKRIQKGEALLIAAKDQQASRIRFNDAGLKQKQQGEEVARLETLVEALGPKGARAKALSEAMGKFQAAVNPYVEPFGWTLSFSVEPWQVFANKRRVETFSKSEQYRIGIALQMGVAMLSGLKWACVDEVDVLDLASRTVVTQMLLDAPLDQIIIMGTRETTQRLPKVEGLLAYRLTKKDGRTVLAERSVLEPVGA